MTAVIPTRGRPELYDAVASALSQGRFVASVIVVNNSGQDLTDFETDDSRVEVIESPSKDGANGARMAGILAARTPLIALLDDDDLWLEGKLAAQLAVIPCLTSQRPSDDWVISCGVLAQRRSGGTTRWPRKFKSQPANGVAEYLFRRDTLRSTHQQLQSSTLLFPRDLALAVPFAPDVRVHQDWEWVLRCEDHGAHIRTVPDYLVTRRVADRSSITQNSRGSTSREWAKKRLAVSPDLLRDFLLTVVLRFDLRDKDFLGAATTLRAAHSANSSLGMSWVVASSLLLKAAFRGAALRNRK